MIKINCTDKLKANQKQVGMQSFLRAAAQLPAQELCLSTAQECAVPVDDGLSQETEEAEEIGDQKPSRHEISYGSFC